MHTHHFYHYHVYMNTYLVLIEKGAMYEYCIFLCFELSQAVL